MIDKRFYDELTKNMKVNPQSLITNMYLNFVNSSECEWDSFYSNTLFAVLSYVRNGNTAKLEEIFYSSFSDFAITVGIFTDDIKKHFEYFVIASTTLLCYEAMLGGVNPNVVSTMQKYIFRKISLVSQIQDYHNLYYETLIAFTTIIGDTKKSHTGNRHVETAISYVQLNINKALSTKDVAGKCGINENHLSRLFLRATGKTLNRYIKEEKIKVACDLLKYTDCTLSEIAAVLNFSTQSHFGSVFKKCKGETPAQYKNNFKNKSNT